jgi:hypothetical protein
MDTAVNEALEYIAKRTSNDGRGILAQADFDDTVATLAAALRRVRSAIPDDRDVEETLVALGMRAADAHDVRCVYRTLAFLKSSSGLF